MGLLDGRHDDRAIFFGELASLLDAGIALRQAMGHLAERGGAPAHVRTLEERAGEGLPLSEGMAACGSAFTPFERQLVLAGERSGGLPEVLKRLAAHHESRGRMRSGILSGIAYPVIVLHLAVLLPNLRLLFMDAGLAGYLGAVVPPIAIAWGIVGVFWALSSLGKGAGARVTADRAVLVVPVVGGIARNLAIADLANALGLLYGAGVPVRQAIEGAGDACPNAAIGAAFRSTARGIDEGLDLTTSIRAAGPILPREFVDLVATGERTGKLPETLAKAEVMYREKGERSAALAVKLVPIAALLIAAAYVGYVAISTISGLYSPERLYGQ